VRAELDRLIVDHAFSGYQALAEWLQAQGYKIADDSLQRYGVRLRCHREALDFARHQAAALAAAHGAGDTAEGLTAFTVQLLQQQVLSILLEAAQLDPSERAGAGEAGNPSPADCEGAARRPGDSSAPALNIAQPKRLDVRDLVRLPRITADLNRITKGRDRRAQQFSSPQSRQSADQHLAGPEGMELSEEAYHAVRGALRDDPPMAPRSPAVRSELAESPAESSQPLSDSTAAAEAQPSISVASRRSPQIAAAARTKNSTASPHTRSPAWSTLHWRPRASGLFPKISMIARAANHPSSSTPPPRRPGRPRLLSLALIADKPSHS
jgi:Protein of unknown function (DUF3486)